MNTSTNYFFVSTQFGYIAKSRYKSTTTSLGEAKAFSSLKAANEYVAMMMGANCWNLGPHTVLSYNAHTGVLE